MKYTVLIAKSILSTILGIFAIAFLSAVGLIPKYFEDIAKEFVKSHAVLVFSTIIILVVIFFGWIIYETKKNPRPRFASKEKIEKLINDFVIYSNAKLLFKAKSSRNSTILVLKIEESYFEPLQISGVTVPYLKGFDDKLEIMFSLLLIDRDEQILWMSNPAVAGLNSVEFKWILEAKGVSASIVRVFKFTNMLIEKTEIPIILWPIAWIAIGMFQLPKFIASNIISSRFDFILSELQEHSSSLVLSQKYFSSGVMEIICHNSDGSTEKFQSTFPSTLQESREKVRVLHKAIPLIAPVIGMKIGYKIKDNIITENLDYIEQGIDSSKGD